MDGGDEIGVAYPCEEEGCFCYPPVFYGKVALKKSSEHKTTVGAKKSD